MDVQPCEKRSLLVLDFGIWGLLITAVWTGPSQLIKCHYVSSSLFLQRSKWHGIQYWLLNKRMATWIDLPVSPARAAIIKEQEYLFILPRAVNPKGNQSWIFIGKIDAKAEAPILWPPDVKSWHIWKDPDAGKDWRQEEKGMTEDKMVGWHHRLGHEFEWALGVGDGQGSLACCSPWGCRVRHNWVTALNLNESTCPRILNIAVLSKDGWMNLWISESQDVAQHQSQRQCSMWYYFPYGSWDE